MASEMGSRSVAKAIRSNNIRLDCPETSFTYACAHSRRALGGSAVPLGTTGRRGSALALRLPIPLAHLMNGARIEVARLDRASTRATDNF
jgi:hypothetical protein